MKKFLLVCAVLCASFVCNAQSQNVKFQGQVDVGTVFMSGGAGPTVGITAGALVMDYFYAGVETGFDSLFSNALVADGYYVYRLDLFEGYIPLGVNMKGYFTKNRAFKPYLNTSLGGFFGLADLGGINGFRFQIGAGFDFKHFNFGIGYNMLYKWGAAHSGYIKLGYRF